MAVLEIIARNEWKRPIYFATSVPNENYYGFKKYFRLEGFAYRLVPYKNETSSVSINTDIMYDNLMNKFTWGRMNADDVYIDNFNIRNFRIMDIRKTFAMLATSLIKEGKNEKAVNVLDKCMEIMPHHKVAFDDSMLGIIDNYYLLNENDKADQIIETLTDVYKQDLIFYKSFKGRRLEDVISLKIDALNDVKNFIRITESHNRIEQTKQLTGLIDSYE